MTHCAKCGAELIGSRKFCAACGTPTVDPRAPANADGGGPASQVNPFAQTALPAMHREKRDSMYGPPPEPFAPPVSTPHVSPLAASNALEQRGAFSEAMSARAPIPGTQVMPSVKNPPSVPPLPPANALAATAPGGRQGGTQVMGAVDSKIAAIRASHPASGIGSPLSSPAASTGEGPARLPSISNQPVAVPTPAPAPAPVAPYPYSPSAVGGYAPPVPAPGPGSPFYPGYQSYQPGARVQVTWANGQRYPGTIHQLAGHQALVVFPDGQQHWVDLQYVAPG